jgi:gamma-glutamyl-gamma-aminobutyrate hydrolase PuuD
VIRVGVTQRVEDVPDRAERRDALDQRWAQWLAPALAVPVPNLGVDAVTFVADLGLAAVVLTGGNDLAALADGAGVAPERDATEASILAHAREARLPVLAVCRGMQMLVHDGGGTVTAVGGHVARDHAITVVDTRWPLRPGPVNSFHDWGIPADGVPADFVILATAADGTVEAVAHRDLPQVGVMWHPERPTRDAADRALLDALLGAPR